MGEEHSITTSRELLDHVKRFVVAVIRMADSFPKNTAGFRIGAQIIDSSGSMGANLLEAQAARSRKEFASTIGIVLKETKETGFWLDIVLAIQLAPSVVAIALLKECRELEKIFAQIIISTNQKEKI